MLQTEFETTEGDLRTGFLSLHDLGTYSYIAA